MNNKLKELYLDIRYGKKNYFSGRRRNEPTPRVIVPFNPESPLAKYIASRNS